MKILNITDSDLDGVACYMILKSMNVESEVIFTKPLTMEKTVNYMLFKKTYKEFDYIFITDLSISEKTMKKIKSYNITNMIFIDHHNTSKHMNNFDFGIYKSVENGINQCGASIFYEYMKDFSKKHNIENSLEQKKFIDFIEGTRLYDTWDWDKASDDIVNYYKPTKMNDYLFEISIPNFIIEISKMMESTNPNFLFSEESEKKMNELALKKERYFKDKIEKVVFDKIKFPELGDREYSYGIIFGENYVSELGNYILKHIDKEIDFIVIFYPPKISIRTIKEDVDVSEIAKIFNGGGHIKASGLPFVNDVELLRKLVFNKK